MPQTLQEKANKKKMGRPLKIATAAELLARDAAFQTNLYNDMKEVYVTLLRHGLDVVKGIAKDTVVTKDGVSVSVPVGYDTRVKWGKMLKELTMDKIIGDKKDPVGGKKPTGGEQLSLEDALKKAAEKRQKAAESTAEKSGKLARIDKPTSKEAKI